MSFAAFVKKVECFAMFFSGKLYQSKFLVRAVNPANKEEM